MQSWVATSLISKETRPGYTRELSPATRRALGGESDDFNTSQHNSFCYGSDFAPELRSTGTAVVRASRSDPTMDRSKRGLSPFTELAVRSVYGIVPNHRHIQHNYTTGAVSCPMIHSETNLCKLHPLTILKTGRLEKQDSDNHKVSLRSLQLYGDTDIEFDPLKLKNPAVDQASTDKKVHRASKPVDGVKRKLGFLRDPKAGDIVSRKIARKVEGKRAHPFPVYRIVRAAIAEGIARASRAVTTTVMKLAKKPTNPYKYINDEKFVLLHSL